MGSSEAGAVAETVADVEAGPSGPGRVRSPDVPLEMSRDRGFVTAEAAVVLPVLVAFTMALVWALMAAAALIQCVDAARAWARAAARQDPPGTV
ncbi:TadE family type IV pilus minor pilin, partial [Streptomyces sp. ActVer]|uniref:TadE family type IV pilus minor pilin n=1 Tax=Streptomyces sp. ActVer TaxID=3014558 RepID=UPI0022B37AEA